MTIIMLPDGHNAEFPDSMPIDQIKAVIQKKYPPTNPGLLQKAGNFAEQNINQPVEQNIVNPIESGIAGFEQGVANVVPGVANLGISGINSLGGNIPKIPRIDIAPHNSAADVGNIASFFSGGGALKLLGKIPELAGAANYIGKIPLIAHGIGEASNILSKYPMASKIAGNAALGGAYTPQNPLLGAVLGGAAPSVGNAISKVVGKTYNYLRPSNLFRGNLTPEQLQQNIKATAGTETGLGDVIGSPTLKKLQENILSKVPFSGAVDTMQRSAGKVVDKGHDILNRLLGKNSGEDVDKSLNDALQAAYKKHHEEKNSLYDEANSIADQIGLQLPLSNFSKKASLYSDALENTNILKYEPEMASMINKLKNYKNPVTKTENVGSIVDQSGQPLINETKLTYPSLKEANLLKGKLNQLADQYKSSPTMTDRHAAGIFRDLASSLKTDIQTAIKKTGHKTLSESYNKAEENYAKKFSPFLDKEIYNFANGNNDSDTLISSFIKTGKANDRANLIDQLKFQLPPSQRKLLGYAYLKRALDENNVVNPLKLKTLLSRNSLGAKQFEALFPSKSVRNALLDYTSLVKKNEHGLGLMENPKTGAMNMDLLPLLSKPVGLGAKSLGSRPLNNWLTNEESRRNLVQQMIANKTNP
jgi:hypothetical protein